MPEIDPDYGRDWRHLQIILRDDDVERIAQRVVALLDERVKIHLARRGQQPFSLPNRGD